MAVPTLAEFRIRFPEFAAVADVVIQLHLDDAESALSETAWGDCYNLAIQYRAAHFIELSVRRAAASLGSSAATAGPVTGSSADGLSVSFAAPSDLSATAAAWLDTVYGKEYFRMLNECVDGRGLVRSPPEDGTVW